MRFLAAKVAYFYETEKKNINIFARLQQKHYLCRKYRHYGRGEYREIGKILSLFRVFPCSGKEF